MDMKDLPSTASLLSPGIWTDATTKSKFYVDPTDATLLLVRSWTDAERIAYNQSASTRATLKAAIGARVVTLKAAAATSTSFATAETARAAVVTGLPLAQVTPAAVQTELALLHTDLSQIAASLGVALVSIADLADVVSSTL